MSDDTAPIAPDTKDWTWVLERPCPDCAFDARTVRPAALPELVAAELPVWSRGLRSPTAGTRPAPATWSVLEYGCHVRDVHRVFAERIGQILDRDGARFANWDQDATALEDRYAEQDPLVVLDELIHASVTVAAAYAAVPDGAWGRTGERSNGSRFTLATLGAYHLHDLVHHGWDISRLGVTRAGRG